MQAARNRWDSPGVTGPHVRTRRVPGPPRPKRSTRQTPSQPSTAAAPDPSCARRPDDLPATTDLSSPIIPVREKHRLARTLQVNVEAVTRSAGIVFGNTQQGGPPAAID